MTVSVHRKVLLLFPTLQRAHIPVEISGDFLPGIQVVAIGGTRTQDLRNRGSLTHLTDSAGQKGGVILRAVARDFQPQLKTNQMTKCDIQRQFRGTALCRLSSAHRRLYRTRSE
jgi:hypothetical protein